jgi:hypothetical protein
LNDWVGSLNGHPQFQTLHIDRLARWRIWHFSLRIPRRPTLTPRHQNFCRPCKTR